MCKERLQSWQSTGFWGLVSVFEHAGHFPLLGKGGAGFSESTGA